MRTEILAARQPEVLDGLKGLADVRSFYLAGGTALALRLGHRRSVDFDFFTAGEFDAMALKEQLAGAFGEVPVRREALRTLYVILLGVTTSFFGYRYALLDPPDATPWSFGLAGIRDIAAMKLEAVAGRGSRKDFVDLYFICRETPLREVFQHFALKYAGSGADPYHRLRALTHFVDAESEPMPEMLVPLEWSDVRRYFEAEVQSLWESGAYLA